MSQEIQKCVWVAGIYNWPASITKEERQTNKNYDRYNWCDIDTTDIKYYESVIKVFQDNKISCIGQRCGKGYHVFGDLVPFDLWLKIWDEIRPFTDPRWAPHTIRISKKRENEVWERPIFYDNDSLDRKLWMKAVMYFLSRNVLTDYEQLWKIMHNCGIHKYFQGTVYKVELK